VECEAVFSTYEFCCDLMVFLTAVLSKAAAVARCEPTKVLLAVDTMFTSTFDPLSKKLELGALWTMDQWFKFLLDGVSAAENRHFSARKLK
jgi:hypothetical protein